MSSWCESSRGPHLWCVLDQEWCTKWGFGGAAEVTLFAVNVYDTTYEPMHVSQC